MHHANPWSGDSGDSVCDQSGEIGRNARCPCGSGKKYKKCCGQASTAPSSLQTADTEELLKAAVRLHNEGRVHEAEAVYRKVLTVHPDCADALHLLGVIALQLNLSQAAIPLIERAIRVAPSPPAFYFANLGSALKAHGEPVRAVECYTKAIELAPQSAEAHNGLGLAYGTLGRFREASECHYRAVALNTNFFAAYIHLAIALLHLGEIDEAIEWHTKSLSMKPDTAEALTNLGTAFKSRGFAAEAVLCYERAILLKPDSPEILNNLGVVRQDQGRAPEAIECYRKALELRPDYPDAYINLGAALKEQGNLAEAIRTYERALALEPPPDHSGAVGPAEPVSIAVSPQNALARWNRAVALLASGDLKEGWIEYEFGWNAKVRGSERPFQQPRWDGGALSGSTILIWGEQGLGDEIIFGSMLSDVVQACGHAVVECEPRLVTLFARSFPRAEIVPALNPPHPRTLVPQINYQSPVGSLARWLRPSLDRFPHHDGYLIADPVRVKHWQARLEALGPGLKVGICWRSGLLTARRSLHYTSLDQWGPIFAVPDVHFVNLQYGDCRAELALAREQFGVEIHEWPDIDLMNDQDELAALITALDLVISAGTAVYALAGAVGKATWTYSLRRGGDWRTFGTDYIPWHPSVRLFERDYDHTWRPVLELIGAELGRLAGVDNSQSDSWPITLAKASQSAAKPVPVASHRLGRKASSA